MDIVNKFSKYIIQKEGLIRLSQYYINNLVADYKK